MWYPYESNVIIKSTHTTKIGLFAGVRLLQNQKLILLPKKLGYDFVTQRSRFRPCDTFQ